MTPYSYNSHHPTYMHPIRHTMYLQLPYTRPCRPCIPPPYLTPYIFVHDTLLLGCGHGRAALEWHTLYNSVHAYTLYDTLHIRIWHPTFRMGWKKGGFRMTCALLCRVEWMAPVFFFLFFFLMAHPLPCMTPYIYTLYNTLFIFVWHALLVSGVGCHIRICRVSYRV